MAFYSNKQIMQQTSVTKTQLFEWKQTECANELADCQRHKKSKLLPI